MPRTDAPKGEHVLGALCRRGHDHEGTGKSMRYASTSGCVACITENGARARENASKTKAAAPKPAAKPKPVNDKPRPLPAAKPSARAPFVKLERDDLELLAGLAEHEEVHGGNLEFGDPLAWRRLELHGLVRLKDGKFVGMTTRGWTRLTKGGGR